MTAAKLLDLSKNPQADGVVELRDGVPMTTSMSPDSVIRTVHDSGLLHLVQNDGLAVDAEILVSKTMIQTPQSFIARPLDAILGVASPEHVSLRVESACNEKKTKTLDQFDNFLASLRGARMVRDPAIVIADELYTNAAKITKGNPSAPTGEMVEFFARADGTRLVLGCRDSQGKLQIADLIARLYACSENGLAKCINYGPGGAGIGSFMVFNSAISYYVCVHLGQATVVCAALPLGLRQREVSELPKNIHLSSFA